MNNWWGKKTVLLRERKSLSSQMSLCLETLFQEPGEIVQWLTTLHSLPEHLSSTPNTHKRPTTAHNYIPSSGLCEDLHTYGTHIYTYSSIKIDLFFKKKRICDLLNIGFFVFRPTFPLFNTIKHTKNEIRKSVVLMSKSGQYTLLNYYLSCCCRQKSCSFS